MNAQQKDIRSTSLSLLAQMIFWSRWLQAPLYLGLIAAQGVYVYHFMVELYHLVHDAGTATETKIMLSVLALIDVVMIANLLIMVIIGGYETFVSRLNIREHPDQPEWLSHVNAATMKIKLSMALIGISSIHLLKTFIEVQNVSIPAGTDAALAAQLVAASQVEVKWQVLIHVTFIISAIAMAITDRIMTRTLLEAHGRAEH
ncbi:MAG TPA: TIGR00645 family protein [Gammaproteobacteria bacterium]|nr:TIGR00645 family protein [Gammaproteobacteria bacterium]